MENLIILNPVVEVSVVFAVCSVGAYNYPQMRIRYIQFNYYFSHHILHIQKLTVRSPYFERYF